MFCSNCGAQNPDGASFCTNCGANISAQPVSAPVVMQPLCAETETMRKKATAAMILGIIACVVAWYPVTSIAAIILGALAISKANKVKAYYASLSQQQPGTSLAGKITGIIGLVGGIMMTVIYILYIILIVYVVVNTTTGTSFNWSWDEMDLDIPTAF